jgi:MinD-like ATPase involved in chromosome partitioning or flagellar assembly
MTSLDITSVKDTTTALKLLSGGMNNEDKIKLVINRATNVNSVREEDVSKVLRREVFWSVPYDEEISASTQLGTPVVIDRPLSGISETIREMAAMLAGVEIAYGGDGRSAEPPASGILTRLFKR